VKPLTHSTISKYKPSAPSLLALLLLGSAVFFSGCTVSASSPQPITNTTPLPSNPTRYYWDSTMRATGLQSYSPYQQGGTVSFNMVKNVQTRTFQIQCTGSMRPAIDCNHWLIAYSPTNESEIHLGDVLEYRSYGFTNYIHRVIYIDNVNGTNYYLMRGDNNLDVDARITFSQIISKITGVWYQ